MPDEAAIWDAGSVPSPGHTRNGDNTLEAYAKRTSRSALTGNSHERHLGLEDPHIMLVAMRHLTWARSR